MYKKRNNDVIKDIDYRSITTKIGEKILSDKNFDWTAALPRIRS